MFGYTRAEVEAGALTWRDLTPPEYVAISEEQLAGFAVTGRIGPYEKEYLRKDGSRSWMVFAGASLGDGTVVEYCIDVNDRKRAEAALREQARLLREVAAAGLTIHSAGSLDSVLRVIAEEARRILGAHRAVASLTVGDDCGQVISAVSTSGAYERWREAGVPPPVEAACAEVCRTNRPLRLTRAELEAHPAWQELSGRRDDYPPLRGWMAAPLISRGGKNLGLIRVSDKDDGDFSESEEAVLAQLAHIASVAIENARLYGELREQDRRKDEFLALLAHELRNPLAPAAQRPAGDAARRSRRQRRRAGPGHDGAAALAHGAADRRPAGRLPHQPQQDGAPPRPRAARRRGEQRRGDGPPRHRGGGARADRLAPARAGPPRRRPDPAGPGVRQPAHQQRQVHPARGAHLARRRAAGEEVVVSVRDNGIGIPAESLRSIFDMFRQVDRSIERSTGGLGIGLALVKGLVEMHGGTVTAESPGPGKGSTFTVRLPGARGRASGQRRRPWLRKGRVRPGRSGASWWWTTTATRRPRWR